MSEKKTTFKVFTIFQSTQEEEYLSMMQEKGWKFTGVNYPGIYHFVKCEPSQYSYRLDYNQEGIKHIDEYVRMFADCGWEHICDFMGYSYFRKEGHLGSEREEIFCDEESKLDMMKRVFRGRLIPLIFIFMLAIMPQLLMNTVGDTQYNRANDILSFVMLGLAILYLAVFTFTAIHFYRYEKKVEPDSTNLRVKYIGIFSLIVAMVVGLAVIFWMSYRSEYDVKEMPNGFVVKAEQLNKVVSREYDLKKGDKISFDIDYHGGRFHFSVSPKGEDSVFYCDGLSNAIPSYEIGEDGRYVIEVSGRKAEGNVEVVIE